LAGSAGKVGFSKAMSAGWILLDKSAGAPTVTRKVDCITDTIKVISLVCLGEVLSLFCGSKKYLTVHTEEKIARKIYE
jgi:hypothetical protein